MKYLENGKIIVYNLYELNYIIRQKEISLELIDIKESGLHTLYGLFHNIEEINGSIDNWDVSNIKSFNCTFLDSKFNCNLSKWDVSNVIDMTKTFSYSNFSGDISSWKFNDKVDVSNIFFGNENFQNKYNNGNKIPTNRNKFLEWFEENREKMKEINLPKEEILDFFSFNNKLNIIN